jgi:hypothetical protein
MLNVILWASLVMAVFYMICGFFVSDAKDIKGKSRDIAWATLMGGLFGGVLAIVYIVVRVVITALFSLLYT